VNPDGSVGSLPSPPLSLSLPRAQGSNGPAPGAHASRGEQGRARAATAAPCSLHSHRRQKRDAAWRADRAGSASCRLRSGRQRARRPGPPSLRRPRRRGGPRLHSHSSSPRLGRPLPVLAPQLVWPSGTRPLPSPLPAHGRSEANAHGWPDFAAPRPRSVRRGRSRPWSVRRHRSRLPAACPAPRLLARGRPSGDRRSQSAAVTASLLSARRRRPRLPLRALLGLLQQPLRSGAVGLVLRALRHAQRIRRRHRAPVPAPRRVPRAQLLFRRPRDPRYCYLQLPARVMWDEA